MSTPKPLYAHERVMYHPELLTSYGQLTRL